MSLNPRIVDWRGLRVWLIGASAGIGEGLAGELGRRGAQLALSARDGAALQRLAGTVHRPPLVLPCDVTDGEAVDCAWETLRARWGGIDLVIYLAGAYQPLDAADPPGQSLPVARQTVAVNFLGALEVGSRVAPWLAGSDDTGRPRGIALVASVAGYRGLPRALAYSSSKAALIAYAESLYHDLSARGVGVWIINPGFVRTRLTAQNDFRMPALIDVERAVAEILAGFAAGRFEIHFPRRFSLLMKLVAMLPATIYFALLRRLSPASPRRRGTT